MRANRWHGVIVVLPLGLGCDPGRGRVHVYDPGADQDDDDGDDDDDAADGDDDDDGDDGDDGGPVDPTNATGGPADDGPLDDDGPDPITGAADDDGPANVCGDDQIGGDEVCDGSDLAGKDCTDHGFDGGELSCAGDCGEFDTDACVTFECGNDVAEGDEVCDGEDLAGQDCVSLGYDGGTLGCSPDCNEIVPHLCITAECGDEIVEGLEVCDGPELDAQTCESIGFDGGTLHCSDTCTALDSSECACDESTLDGDVGAAVASGTTAASADDTLPPSCAMGGGNDHVVAFTAPADGQYVFDTIDSDYDTTLAAFEACDPASELACNDDTAGQQSQITLDLDEGQTVLLVIDGWEGDTGPWVLNVNAGTDSCVETEVTAVGSPAAAGNTNQQDEDLAQSCAEGGAADHVVRFVAPATGTFVFDTFGSGYDTALAAYTSCDPDDEFVCNDDAGGGTQSQIALAMMVGQEVLIAVSGFDGATGNWELNVTQD